MMERTAAVESPTGGIAPASGTVEPAIELRGLRRDFGERTALPGISARLERGESLAVLGPRGSGTSPLRRILAGRSGASGGGVSVLGCASPKETHRLRGRV